jgi:hypothetical protein
MFFLEDSDDEEISRKRRIAEKAAAGEIEDQEVYLQSLYFIRIIFLKYII